jgi:hypothetical protein
MRSVGAAHESFAAGAEEAATGMMSAVTDRFEAINVVQIGFDPLFGEAADAAAVHRQAAADLGTLMGRSGSGMMFLGAGARVAAASLQSADAGSSLSVHDVEAMLARDPKAARTTPAAKAVVDGAGRVVGFDFDGDGKVDQKLAGGGGSGTAGADTGPHDSSAALRIAEAHEPPFEVPSEHPGWVDLSPRLSR